MSTHQAEATVASDGSVLIQNVPFPSGQLVRVVIEPEPKLPVGKSELWKTLVGKPLVYIDPHEPAVPPEDWEVYQ